MHPQIVTKEIFEKVKEKMIVNQYCGKFIEVVYN